MSADNSDHEWSKKSVTELIGEYVRTFAVFEGMMKFFLAEMAELHPQTFAWAVTSELTTDQMIKLFKALNLQHEKNLDPKKLNDLSKEMRSVVNRRNRIVHDLWSEKFGTGDLRRFEAKIRSAFDVHIKPESRDSLLVSLAELMAVSLKLGNYYFDDDADEEEKTDK